MQLDLKDLGPSVNEAVVKARRGEEVTIAERGHPVARIIATGAPSPVRRPEFGTLKGLIEIAEDFNAPLETEI